MAEKGDTPVKWGMPAAADLSGSQFHAVAVDANGKAALAANPFTDNYLGPLATKPVSGAHATAEALGMVKAKAGGTISAGDDITYTTSGYYVKGNKALPRTTAQSGTTIFINSAYALVGQAITGVASGGVFTMWHKGLHTIVQSN